MKHLIYIDTSLQVERYERKGYTCESFLEIAALNKNRQNTSVFFRI